MRLRLVPEATAALHARAGAVDSLIQRVYFCIGVCDFPIRLKQLLQQFAFGIVITAPASIVALLFTHPGKTAHAAEGAACCEWILFAIVFFAHVCGAGEAARDQCFAAHRLFAACLWIFVFWFAIIIKMVAPIVRFLAAFWYTLSFFHTGTVAITHAAVRIAANDSTILTVARTPATLFCSSSFPISNELAFNKATPFQNLLKLCAHHPAEIRIFFLKGTNKTVVNNAQRL